MNSRHMHLNLFLEWSGRRPGAWRLPTADLALDNAFPILKRATERAEAAKMDAVFIADTLKLERYAARHPSVHMLEPFTLAGALAAVTSRIGIIATVSTTFFEPYNLARAFSTLDHISQGRVGWNIVTSRDCDENFNVGYPPHDERYIKADEYVEVVTRLWDSWDEDAVINDPEAGQWAHEDRIRPINFAGKYYRVAGPLNVGPSPQRRPVLVQAGASAAGVDFAASWAELVFTLAPTLESAQQYSRNIKAIAAKFGRDPSQLKIMPGLQPIIAENEKAAEELAAHLSSLVDFEFARGFLSYQIGHVRLDDLEPDEPIPVERLPAPEAIPGEQSRYRAFYHQALEERLTVRQLSVLAIGARGHSYVVGTAEQVADQMQDWFTQGACDGFQLQPYDMDNGLKDFTDQVIPLLQDRGLFRTDYEGTTLRDHLGLKKLATGHIRG